jgi:predicted ester cyclase
MMSDENKALIRRWYEEWRVDGKFPEGLFTADFRAHIAGSPTMDLKAFEQNLGAMYAVLSDFDFTFADMLAEGDKVAARIVVHATHSAEFMGVSASGKRISLASTAMARIAAGKIAEWWNIPNQLSLMQQLGLVLAPEG